MQVKSAALIAGLASTAAAFVIVPEITNADDALFSILPVEVPATAEAQTLKLNCPGCPVRLPGDVVVTDAENHLELHFRVEHTPGFDRLLVNDFELYPNADPFSGSLAAPHIIDVAERAMRRGMMPKAEGGEVPLGYRIEVYPIAKEEEGQVLELVGVDLQIIEVGQTFVEGIPNVHVKLIKNGENLAIANVETTAPKAVPEAQCDSFWCMWKQMLSKGLGMLKKPCPGKMGHGMMPKPEDMPEMPEGMPHGHGHGHHGMGKGMGMHHGEYHGHMNIPGHGHPHHHHGGHHHGQFQEGMHSHHGFFRLAASIMAHVILPVLIGIVAGISISLIGMAICSAVLCFVRLARGRRASGNGCPFQRMCRKSSAKEVVVVEEEKAGLMENQEQQDPPPSYEADSAPRV